MRELLSAYKEHEDLISIGAYRRGNNKQVDAAIELMAEMNNFLRQRVDEPSSVEAARDALMALQRRVAARQQAAASGGNWKHRESIISGRSIGNRLSWQNFAFDWQLCCGCARRRAMSAVAAWPRPMPPSRSC